MNIVPREQWGARPPVSRVSIQTPTPELWLHHEAGEGDGPASVRAIQSYHMDQLDWSDIGYSFLVDDDGSVYEGRGAGVQGAHTYEHNSVSHGICAMGNYETRPPSDTLLKAIAELVRYGAQQGWWPGALTGGHSDVNQTACPGQYLYARLADINRLATQAAAPAPAPAPPPPSSRWVAVTVNDIDFAIARDTLHLKAGLEIRSPTVARAEKWGGAVYVGAADVPAQPWLFHRRTLQATGAGAPETRLLCEWLVKSGLPPL